MNILEVPIVKRCCSASQAINDYFVEERYVAEVEQSDIITPDFVSVLALDLLLDELAEIGIETNNNAEDILMSPTDLTVAFTLREKLDKDNFYRLVKSLSEKQYSNFLGVVENCVTAEDLLIELVDYFTSTIPTDTEWDLISRTLDIWYSTEAFSNHISAIQSKVDIASDKNVSYVTDKNITNIANFLKRMKQREAMVNTLVKYIYKQHPSLNIRVLENLIAHYDKDKLKPELLPLFAEYNATHPDKEPDFLKEHHHTIRHHLEYWELHKDEQPSREDCIMIFVSLLLDGFRKDSLKKEINRFTMFNNEYIDLMTSLVDIDWDAVLRGEL